MPRQAGRSTLAWLRASEPLALAAALMMGAAAALAGPPERVVSINLCTDQMAMLLAAPGQLVSVSRIAADRQVSAMADQAAGYPLNHGQAEEVYRLAPDLVLAGPFTSRYTVGLLRRLGVEVRELPLVERLEDIPDRLMQMAQWLGRDAAGRAAVAEFEAGLALLRAELAPTAGATPPRAVLHYANNYTSGIHTLAHQILITAGFANLAAEAGLEGGGTLPMERLLMLAPDLVIAGQAYPGQTRAEAVLDHPAMRGLRAHHARGTMADAEWVCGTPHVLGALARLVALHPQLAPHEGEGG